MREQKKSLSEEPPSASGSSLTFEAALSALEEIVRKLEEGRVSLEDAVALYQDGAELKARCEAKLSEAQLKIEKIIVKNSEVVAEPFDPTSSREE